MRERDPAQPPVRFLPRPSVKRLAPSPAGIRPLQTSDGGRLERKAIYQSAEWRRARAAFLRDHPICVAEGCESPAEVVDHSAGHSGEDWREKFWDRSNWQPMCRRCHNVKTNAEIERHSIGRALRRRMPFR
jgi:5-methylcytosine-specific restriction protein A